MTLFDLIHLALHFTVIGSYLYLLLAVLLQFRNTVPRVIYVSLIIVCITMIFNLLHQATYGQFIFGDFTLRKLHKLPIWLITNGLNSYVLYYFLRDNFKRLKGE